MNRSAILILLTLLAVFSSTPATYAQAGPNEESITSVLTRYDNAWNKKDVDGVSRILAEDYVYFSSTGDLTKRKATLDFLASPDYKLTSVSRSEIAVLSQNDRVSIVSSRWKGRGTYGKEEINDDQRCGLVFVREEKSWKLLSEHCVQIVAK
jgi:ketosteroid isomerase-like protein